ncbi:MAG: cytochrome c peroxidase [Gammaproteobacteria bacterium]
MSRWRIRNAVGLTLAAMIAIVTAAAIKSASAPVSASGLPSAPVSATDFRAGAPQRHTEPITPIPPASASQSAKIALGELLFRDRRLSRYESRSCASCHDIDDNGATHTSCDTSPDNRSRCFNTPTLFNAALSFRFGWEGRFRTLEAQALDSLANPREMGASLDEVVAKLNHDPAVTARFREVYRRVANTKDLVNALAAFERSLTTPDSRFDRWLAGEPGALSEQELAGYRLFKSVGCISCHQGVNLGGNLFEKQGVFRPLAGPDPAMMRVPSLRNIAATAPYFHDGSAASLEETVQRMASAQLDAQLTPAQIDAIAAWMSTLTGNYRGRRISAHP